MNSNPLDDLLARAAQGDMAAAAAFMRVRAASIQAQERFTASGRAAAWRMLRPSM
ncbi:hypothetical protein [Streptomyces sp. XH2]|uniref:hypothetical protein n=1 Tax=Streptomyces sp. XH2 TaxID=3412483 RepID=UPI003C7D1D0F